MDTYSWRNTHVVITLHILSYAHIFGIRLLIERCDQKNYLQHGYQLFIKWEISIGFPAVQRAKIKRG